MGFFSTSEIFVLEVFPSPEPTSAFGVRWRASRASGIAHLTGSSVLPPRTSMRSPPTLKESTRDHERNGIAGTPVKAAAGLKPGIPAALPWTYDYRTHRNASTFLFPTVTRASLFIASRSIRAGSLNNRTYKAKSSSCLNISVRSRSQI